MPILVVVGWPAAAVGSQPRLVSLPAGMRIGDKAPKEWTNLVIKSIPELKSGDLDSLPTVAHRTATMFRTVILADVQPLGLDKQFILTRVGLGMCVPSRDGRKDDVVVTSDRLEALSLRLSTVEKIVLEAAETEMAESRIIAFTSSFALMRSPAMLVVNGQHKKVDLYYAFCVDPVTGKLHVGAWSMWPSDIKRQPPPPFVIDVAPKTVYKCAVDVESKRILLGTIPVDWSFAMQKLPPGRVVNIEGNKVLGQQIVTFARHPIEVETHEFEKMLRKVLTEERSPVAGRRATRSAVRRTAVR